jgi:hypothetical protein
MNHNELVIAIIVNITNSFKPMNRCTLLIPLTTLVFFFTMKEKQLSTQQLPWFLQQKASSSSCRTIGGNNQKK